MDTTAIMPTPARPATPIAAGEEDRIPRVFLGLADLAILTLTFVLAQLAAPSVQRLFLRGGLLEGVLPAVFPLPPGPRPELFPPLTEVSWLLIVTMPVTLVAMELLGGYDRLLTLPLPRLVAGPLLSQVTAISFCALIVFALKLSGSGRVLIFTYGLLTAAALLAYRGAIWGYQRRQQAHGVYARNVMLIGQPGVVTWLARHVRAQVNETQFRLIGWLEAPLGSAAPAASAEIRLARLGAAADLGEILVNTLIHEVIAVQPAQDGSWMRSVMEHCDYFRIRLRIVPEILLHGNLHDLEIAFRGDPLRLPEVVLTPPHLDADSLFVKRLIDIVASTAMLVLLSPLFLIIAIAIKLTTPHLPVFYPWHVIGYGGRPFTGYKFTTMVADADERRARLVDRNEMQGPVFKIKDDPRVTPLGRFLRKFSLNELPQLWSVLKGDMSLVGPRPAGPHELVRYELWHKRKLCVKPGVTCLWQVSGRNRISNFDDWVRLDLEYMERWTLWLDLKILGRTVWAVVSGSGS
ncbi:MAG: sugar transferase [Acidobacteria bacterium]|nr:sugar transferase [Acidobacteriota bacterium]